MSDSEDEKSASNKEASESNEEDDEMKKLLEGFVSEMGVDEDDSDASSSSSSESGEERREIELEDNYLDHVVLAAGELEAAMVEFQEKTGVEPRISGSIKGLGIKTARVSFEGSSFLEIIAPDPDAGGPIGNLLRASGLKGLKPFHWAIRSSKAGALQKECKQIGYTPDCISMFGARDDGTPRKWEMLYLYGHKLRGMCPFFINWDNSDHPCETMPVVGDLIHVKVTAPGEDKIHQLIEMTEASGFSLDEGDPHFEIKFDSPEGEVTFSAKKMVGFRFPGFEDEVGDVDDDVDDEMPEFVMPEMPEMVQVGDYDNSASGGMNVGEMDESELARAAAGDYDYDEEGEEGEKKKKKKKDKKKKDKDGEKKKKKKKKKKEEDEEGEVIDDEEPDAEEEYAEEE